MLIDDFESYSVGNLNGQGSWAGSTLWQVQSSVTFSGSRAVSFDLSGGSNDNINKGFTGVSAGIQQFYIRSTVTNVSTSLQFREGTTNKCSFEWTSGGNLDIVGATRQTILAGSINTWYQIDVEIDAANDRFRARADGGAWTDWVGAFSTFTVIDDLLIRRFGGGASSGTLYYDDFGDGALPPINPPTVITDPADEITPTSARGNAETVVTGGENGTARGLVFGTSSQSAPGNVSPGSSGYDEFVQTSGDYADVLWTMLMEDLMPGTTYYYRAYQQNSAGWGYGEQQSFTTPDLQISGTVTLNSSPVENAVIRCIRQSDNVALAQQVTDSSGEYIFTGLDENELYHLAVEYESEGQRYNALSLWDIEPVEVEL